MLKMKYLIVQTLAVISLSLSACGNQTDTSANNQVANNTPKVEETVEVDSTEEVQEPEVEETEPEVEVESTEEIVEETVPEEPEVEMVDFETWAKQEGNDEVCLVVWNETSKKQKIIEPNEKYVIEEGDRFAVPYREFTGVKVGTEDIYWENTSYLELNLPQDEIVKILILDGSNGYTKYYKLLNQ